MRSYLVFDPIFNVVTDEHVTNLRNNQLKFKKSRKLPIIAEESIEYSLNLIQKF